MNRRRPYQDDDEYGECKVVLKTIEFGEIIQILFYRPLKTF